MLNAEVDDLTKGALVVKEDLAKVELYGCMAALRDVRAKCVKMNECIMKVGYPGMGRAVWQRVELMFLSFMLSFYLQLVSSLQMGLTSGLSV